MRVLCLLARVGDELRREVVEALREEFAPGRASVAVERLRRGRETLQRKVDQALENMGVVNAQVAARVGAKVEEWSTRLQDLDAEITAAQSRRVRRWSRRRRHSCPAIDPS